MAAPAGIGPKANGGAEPAPERVEPGLPPSGAARERDSALAICREALSALSSPGIPENVEDATRLFGDEAERDARAQGYLRTFWRTERERKLTGSHHGGDPGAARRAQKLVGEALHALGERLAEESAALERIDSNRKLSEVGKAEERVAEKKRAAAGRASILAKLDAAIGQIDERHGAIATRWSKLGKTPAEPSTDHLLRADIRLAAVLAAAGPSPDLPALATRAFEIGDRLLVRAILTLGMVASGDTIALRQLARACSGRASAVSREALLGDPEGAQLAAEAHALSTLRRQLAGLRQDAKGNMRDEPEILRQRAAKLFGQLASK